eukprot:jgi/Orpsp1_1/1181582/evm.model.c7180000077787.1
MFITLLISNEISSQSVLLKTDIKSSLVILTTSLFGCKVFYHSPKSFRNKFDNNSLPGIFLGYSEYDYKILDITYNKIVYSRSVDFFENDLGFSTNFTPQNLLPIYKIEGDINNPSVISTNKISLNKLDNNNTIEYIPNTTKRNMPYKTYQITKKVKIYIPTLLEPVNYNGIFNLEDKDLWLEAVQNELNSMKKMKIYTMVESVPETSNIISCRWIFKYKRDLKGNIIKRKTRLVARGFTQQIGIDFKETFSPNLKHDSLRIITAISTQLGFNIEQIDINSAYLNAHLEENIYMNIPEGHPGHGKLYWKLNKALYGLKQAGKAWNDKLNNELITLNFKRLQSEPCVYVKRSKEGKILCILVINVDDILISENEPQIEITKRQIKRKFNIKEIGDVDFVIGIKFEKYENGYFLNQERYINDILNKYNIDNNKKIRTLKPLENEKLRKRKFDETVYRSAIGRLLYLAICTRPNILFS